MLESTVFSPDQTSIYATDQQGDKIIRFSFDSLTGELGNSEIVFENPESQLNFPHGLSFSPDGKYLAVSNLGDNKITIYRVDE